MGFRENVTSFDKNQVLVQVCIYAENLKQTCGFLLISRWFFLQQTHAMLE